MTLKQTREGVKGEYADKSRSAQGRGLEEWGEGSRGRVVSSDPRTGATVPRADFLQRVAVPHNSCWEEE